MPVETVMAERAKLNPAGRFGDPTWISMPSLIVDVSRDAAASIRCGAAMPSGVP